MTAFRIELRRSSALLLAAATVVVGALLLWLLADEWTARWSGLAYLMRALLFALVPVALAAGAWQGGRDRRAGVTELFGTVARPYPQRLLPVALAMAAGVLVAYAALLAGGSVQVAPYASYAGGQWPVVVAVGAVALVAAAWLGMAVGRWVPSVLTPPTLLVFSFLGQMLSRLDNGVLLPVLATPSDLATVAPEFLAAQGVWFGGLAAAALLLVASATVWARALAAAVALAAAGVSSAVAPATAFVVSTDGATLVCADGEPRVCAPRIHAAVLPALTEPAREALRTLAPIPNAPTRVVATDLGWAPVAPQRTTDVLVVDLRFRLNATGRFEAAPAGLRTILLKGAGTQSCPDPAWGFERDVAADQAATGWVTGRPAGPATDEYGRLGERTLSELKALPRPEQLARLAAYRTAKVRCDRDPLTALTTGAPR
ncbi:hypothetical protein GCM10022251_75060 [Phytohabitans flavus]|uniref:Uncharacterized protein n=1 Tax=Phytohabitans flavus TaxID=1076124 RepID=A0A6F8XLE7_9ACTN|nr:hypothetical protein [Phytohabitans flavus]BCB74635.1 hypothetical protein Pflav_010450 [Phytohabitans flavus]